MKNISLLKWVNPAVSTTTDDKILETLKYTIDNILVPLADITFTVIDKNRTVFFTDTNSQESSGKTNLLGRATVSLYTTSWESEECTINAHLTKKPDIKAPPLTVKFIAAVKAITLLPKDAEVSTSDSLTLTATVTDSNDKVKPGVLVTFDATNDAVLSKKSDKTDKNGQVVTKLSNNKTGPVTVTATAAGKSDQSSVKFLSSVKLIDLQPKDVEASISDSVTLTATVTGTDNKPKPQMLVTFEANNGGVLSKKSDKTNEKGQAVTALSSSQPGSVTVTATVGDKSDRSTIKFHQPDYILHIPQPVPVTFYTTNPHGLWMTVKSPTGKNVDALDLTVNTGKYLVSKRKPVPMGEGSYLIPIVCTIPAEESPDNSTVSVSYLTETSNVLSCIVKYDYP